MRDPGKSRNRTLFIPKIDVFNREYENSLISKKMSVFSREYETNMIFLEIFDFREKLRKRSPKPRNPNRVYRFQRRKTTPSKPESPLH